MPIPPPLVEEQQWYDLTHNWEDKGVHAFPKGISLKVNVMAQLGFEFAYSKAAVQLFNHYSMEISPRRDW